LEIIDLRTVSEAAARDWVPLAYDRKIDLGFELASAPMLGDALLLPELVNNLIDNALRYTPPGGTVTVRTGLEHDGPYLNVEDTGPGIPSSERDKVRERFYRIAGSPGEGSGLGLAIVKEVVDRHHGKLEIYPSEAAGTCVRVSFPQNGELHAQK
jgi:two-component system sensor histidine kinase TctE